MSISPKTLAVMGIVAVGVAAVVVLKSRAPAQDAGAITTAAVAQPTALANATAPGRKLLFFMNPNGYPCQTQLSILDGVADSLSKVAQLVFYKTTEAGDMQKFEQYGIRGLPTLVIADRDGRELSRLSPGVQSSDAVLAALTK